MEAVVKENAEVESPLNSEGRQEEGKGIHIEPKADNSIVEITKFDESLKSEAFEMFESVPNMDEVTKQFNESAKETEPAGVPEKGSIVHIPQRQESIIGRVIKIVIAALQIDKKRAWWFLAYFAIITFQDFYAEKADQLVILDLFKWFTFKMFKNIVALLIFSNNKRIADEIISFHYARLIANM